MDFVGIVHLTKKRARFSTIESFQKNQDGGEAFNKEVIQVLKKMPVWIPGLAKGENVSVYHTIPVKFVIQE